MDICVEVVLAELAAALALALAAKSGGRLRTLDRTGCESDSESSVISITCPNCFFGGRRDAGDGDAGRGF